MRLCPSCHNIIPEPLLACLACVMRKSTDEVARLQVGALRKVLEEGGELITVAQNGVRHVKACGIEQTFCGRDVAAHDRRGRLNPTLVTFAGICPHCRTRIEDLIEKGKTHA